MKNGRLCLLSVARSWRGVDSLPDCLGSRVGRACVGRACVQDIQKQIHTINMFDVARSGGMCQRRFMVSRIFVEMYSRNVIWSPSND